MSAQRLQLAPLALANMRALAEGYAEPAVEGKRRLSAIEVTRWQCPECFDEHDYEDDAEECCQGKDSQAAVPSHLDSISCPVCGRACADFHVAASCCLWKDLDAPTRWRIADAVEAGSTWQDELQALINPS